MGLMLGKGCRGITREELDDIETPEGTRTWRPVPHCEIVDLVVETAEREKGWKLDGEEYGVAGGGRKMFGVLRFSAMADPGCRRALGIRNSNDRSLALGLTAGLSVIVCSNLCFGGELVVYRRHTAGIDPAALIPDIFPILMTRYGKLDADVLRLKSQEIGADEARALVVRVAEAGAIPSSDVLTVLGEYERPRHEEFAPRTRWSLHNAFTEVAKKFSAPRADRCYRRLAKIFGLT